ncbi:unnamed protein product [Ostreobium quekettii]|uniref:Uncharacterized protein n=1 Tax=Ostreobium quekettii TaxID=121088 RepID=A0A8S1J093_9CHLO|nr:unnamed protein product [Ostreobium quekettii]
MKDVVALRCTLAKLRPFGCSSEDGMQQLACSIVDHIFHGGGLQCHVAVQCEAYPFSAIVTKHLSHHMAGGHITGYPADVDDDDDEHTLSRRLLLLVTYLVVYLMLGR